MIFRGLYIVFDALQLILSKYAIQTTATSAYLLILHWLVVRWVENTWILILKQQAKEDLTSFLDIWKDTTNPLPG